MHRSIPLLALVLLFAVPASASALSKPRWKTSTITYRDTTKGSLDKGAVKTAVKWWNDVPGPVVFKKARSGAKANITFRSVNTSGVDYDGLANYYTDRTNTYIVTATLDLNDFFLKREGKEYVSEVTAHELGHAIGLPHLKDDCSLMYPSGSVATRCPTDAGPKKLGSDQFYCGPQRSDVSSLLSRYPGKLGTWPGTICTGTPPDRARSASRAPRHG
jgi:Matrixin